MRIIGNIEHPVLKITVFKMENKISIKFESGLYEQTYKFRTGDGMETFEDVEKLVDSAFLERVGELLQTMHEVKSQALLRQFTDQEEDEFETII
jgi:hypothetical protein